MRKISLVILGLFLGSFVCVPLSSAEEDITPPVLQSILVSPSFVIAGGEVTVTIEATDSPAGVNTSGIFPSGGGSSTQARLRNPSNTQFSDVIFSDESGHV